MSEEPPLDQLLPTPMTSGDPATIAAAITARSGTSFSAGMAILPRPRREGMRAIYAFCRVVDDIADGDFPVEEKHEALAAWREEVERLYAGAPLSAVGAALLPAVDAFDLPEDEFLLMIEGMAMDADGPIIAPTREVLDAYIRRVAVSVGMLSMRVFGAWRGDVSARFADALGQALQLTNILRDVEDDAAIGRLYLPRELLEAHGLSTTDPDAVTRHPALPAARQALGSDARACYDAARRFAEAHTRWELRPALLMMGAYEGYLDKIEAADWRPGPPDSLMSKRDKVLRGLRYAVLGPGRAPAASDAPPRRETVSAP